MISRGDDCDRSYRLTRCISPFLELVLHLTFYSSFGVLLGSSIHGAGILSSRYRTRNSKVRCVGQSLKALQLSAEREELKAVPILHLQLSLERFEFP